MKLSSIPLVTADVSLLANLYQKITGIVPVGSGDFVELEISGVNLAICSARSMEMSSPGAASAAANRSAILEFQVDDVEIHSCGPRQRFQDHLSVPSC